MPGGLLGGFARALMPSPAGGLLGEEDIHRARQQGLLGLGASLLASGGPNAKQGGTLANIGQALQASQGTYQGAVDQTMNRQGAQQAMQMNQQKMAAAQAEQQQAQQLATGRKAIFDKYGQPDMKSPQGTAQWLDQVMPELMAIGDTETLGRFAEVRKTLGGQQSKEPGSWVTVPGPDGQPMRRYITAGEAGQEGIQEYEEPRRDAGATLLDQQRMFTRAQQLEGDYRSVTKSIQQAADQFRTMTAMADQAKAGSPQAQIGLIFSYMKTLDPGSVVRESEYATAQNAAGVPERVRNQYNKLLDGSFLTPKQIDGFLSAGRGMAAQWRRQQDLHRKTYGERASRWGVNPQDVTTDFFAGMDLTPAPNVGDKTNEFGVLSGGSTSADGNTDLRSRYGGLR